MVNTLYSFIERGETLAVLEQLQTAGDSQALTQYYHQLAEIFSDDLDSLCETFVQQPEKRLEMAIQFSERWYAFLDTYLLAGSPYSIANLEAADSQSSIIYQRQLGRLLNSAGRGILAALRQRSLLHYQLLLLVEPAWFFRVNEILNAEYSSEQWQFYFNELATLTQQLFTEANANDELLDFYQLLKSPIFNALECRWLVEVEVTNNRAVRRSWAELIRMRVVELHKLRNDQVVPLKAKNTIIPPVMTEEVLEELLLYESRDLSSAFFSQVANVLCRTNPRYYSALYSRTGALCYPAEFVAIQQQQMRELVLAQSAYGSTEDNKVLRQHIQGMREQIQFCAYDEQRALSVISAKKSPIAVHASKSETDTALSKAFESVIATRRRKAQVVKKLHESSAQYLMHQTTLPEDLLEVSFELEALLIEYTRSLSECMDSEQANSRMKNVWSTLNDCVKSIPFEQLLLPKNALKCHADEDERFRSGIVPLEASVTGQAFLHELAKSVASAISSALAACDSLCGSREEHLLQRLFITEATLSLSLASVQIEQDDETLLSIALQRKWLKTELTRELVRAHKVHRLALLLRCPGVLAAHDAIGDPINTRSKEVELYLLSIAQEFIEIAEAIPPEAIVQDFFGYTHFARSPYEDLFNRREYPINHFVDERFTLSTNQALTLDAERRKALLALYVRQMNSLYHDSDSGLGWFSTELFTAIKQIDAKLWSKMLAAMISAERSEITSEYSQVNKRKFGEIRSITAKEGNLLARWYDTRLAQEAVLLQEEYTAMNVGVHE